MRHGDQPSALPCAGQGLVAAAVAATLLTVPLSASAQSVEQFFKGKTVKLVVTQGPAGYYDIGARLMARHWGRFIPGNPNVVVQNQTGAAGVGLANRFAAGTVESDGTTLGVLQRGVPQYAFIGYQGIRFDPLKSLGRQPVIVCDRQLCAHPQRQSAGEVCRRLGQSKTDDETRRQ